MNVHENFVGFVAVRRTSFVKPIRAHLALNVLIWAWVAHHRTDDVMPKVISSIAIELESISINIRVYV